MTGLYYLSLVTDILAPVRSLKAILVFTIFTAKLVEKHGDENALKKRSTKKANFENWR